MMPKGLSQRRGDAEGEDLCEAPIEHLSLQANCDLRFLRVSAPLRETFIDSCRVDVCRCLDKSRHAENWERFRGPNGAGQGEAAGIPSEWTEADYLWQQALPGVGHSSPVIWDERLFVTSGDPKTGEQIVLAFDAASGRAGVGEAVCVGHLLDARGQQLCDEHAGGRCGAACTCSGSTASR